MHSNNTKSPESCECLEKSTEATQGAQDTQPTLGNQHDQDSTQGQALVPSAEKSSEPSEQTEQSPEQSTAQLPKVNTSTSEEPHTPPPSPQKDIAGPGPFAEQATQDTFKEYYKLAPKTHTETEKESGRIAANALPSSYRPQAYKFLLQLFEHPDFSLTPDKDIQIKGVQLEPYNITTLLRIAFLKFHKGELPHPLQEWLRKTEIPFPTMKTKLRPQFQPMYSFRKSTIEKAPQH